NFPTQLFAFAGLSLKGYHFFYDFLAAEFISFYHLDIYDVVFRLLPFFISALYGMSFIAVARFLKMDKTTSIFLLYLAFFTTDVVFLLPLVLHKTTIVYNAGLNPLIMNILDPSVLLATAVLFAFFILTFAQKQRS